MKSKAVISCALAGIVAGTVTGLFGAGGGMVLVPLLCWLTDLQEDAIFPSSVSIILPICMVSLAVTGVTGNIPWKEAVPYLFGSAAGGVIAGIWGKKIPTIWLHRILGGMILWGGIRYLC